MLGVGAAQAQTPIKLVSNTGLGTPNAVTFQYDYAQKFTTGSSPRGFTLTRVDLRMLGHPTITVPTYNLRIQSNSASNRPGSTVLGSLTQPSGSLPIPAGLAKFTANDGIQLAANTDYWLVFDVTANPSFDYKIYEIASDDENADSSAGWSIANRSLFRSWNFTSWSTDTTSAVLAVWGYSNQIEGIVLDPRYGAFTIPFDRALKPHHCPILGAWTVTVDGENRRVVSGRCDSQSVWLRLSRHTGWFAPGQEVTLSYDKTNATIGTQGRRLKYADDDSEVENFSLNLQKGTFVAETEVTGATVSGSRLTLTFDEALDEGSAPPGSAFRLKAFFRDGLRDCLGGCAVKGIGRARVSGDTVTVDLDTHISGGRVKVEYHAPSDSPLRTSAGRTVPSYRGTSAIVTLAVTDTTPPTLQSAKVYTGNPFGIPQDEAWVILTFDEGLMGPAPLDSDFHVTVNGERRSTRYSSGIVFGRTARVLLDSSVSPGDTVKVGYTKRGYRPWDHWTSLRDPSFNKVESFSDVTVSVTGGPPVLVGAGVDGTRLTVTFNEPLDATSVPAPGDFHVTVGASRRNVAADGVAINGPTAVLTLASAVTGADTVTMRYTRGKSPLLDLDDDAVSTFADQAVTNDTEGTAVRERRGGWADADRHLRQDPGRDVGAGARRFQRHSGQRPAQRRRRRHRRRRRGRDAHPGVGGEKGRHRQGALHEGHEPAAELRRQRGRDIRRPGRWPTPRRRHSWAPRRTGRRSP